MNKKLKSFVLIVGILLSTSTIAYGAPQNSSNIPPAQVNLQQINELVNEKNNLEVKIQKTDMEIEKLLNEEKSLNEKIKINEKNIVKNEILLKETKDQLDNSRNVMNERIKGMYMHCMPTLLSYIDIMLSSKDINDLIERYNSMKSIIEFDKKTVDTVKIKQNEIEKVSLNLKKEKDENEISRKELEKKKLDISNIKNQQVILLSQLKTQVNSLSESNKFQNINSVNAFNNEVLSKLANIKSDFSLGKRAVELASSFLGTPYFWGGSQPGGFDCSGLMQYVYNKLGVSIPRVSQDQQNAGIEVPKGCVQPGDLLLFGYPAHHVGMYVGDGVMIHAPHTGDVVRFKNINLDSVTSIRRVALK